MYENLFSLPSNRLEELALSASKLFNCRKEVYHTQSADGNSQGGAFSNALKSYKTKNNELDKILNAEETLVITQNIKKRKRSEGLYIKLTLSIWKIYFN